MIIEWLVVLLSFERLVRVSRELKILEYEPQEVGDEKKKREYSKGEVGKYSKNERRHFRALDSFIVSITVSNNENPHPTPFLTNETPFF